MQLSTYCTPLQLRSFFLERTFQNSGVATKVPSNSEILPFAALKLRPNQCTVCKVNSRIRSEKNKCKIVYAIEVHSACYASLGVSSFCSSGILSYSRLEILCNWCRFMLRNLHNANNIVDDAFVISYTLRRHDSPCMK